MAAFVTEVVSRVRALQTEIESLKNRRDELEAQQTELERVLEATRLLLAWEGKHNGAIIPDEALTNGNVTTRWSGVSLTEAIARLIEEHPEWQNLERKVLFPKVRDQLIEDNFDFGGKVPAFSVNIALSKVMQPDSMRKKDGNESPDQE